MTGGHRTFLVLIIATITSLLGKKHWDDKYKSSDKQSKKKNRGAKGDKFARHENYDPEVGRGSFFDD